jgi:hypothetical protein
MKIQKENRNEIKDALSAWAKGHKAKVSEDGESFKVEAKTWWVEVIPENGWAYLHGHGDLHGASTNISSIDQFEDAVNRLKGDK